MRIIAGEHRGRTILGPKDASTTRPITDRVKTSLFDRLCHSLVLLGPDLGGSVLDIFSGTGSMGLEALSRGAAHCIFVEQDRDAITRLERNLATLKLQDRAQILRINALRPGWVHQLPRQALPVRVAFLNPPYAMLDTAEDRSRLAALIAALGGVMELDGAAVLRTRRGVALEAVPGAGWDEPARYDYGSMTLHFFIGR